MTSLLRTYETGTFLEDTAVLDLVGDVLDVRLEPGAAVITCQLERLRPKLYDSYGTRYENVYLPVVKAGVGTIRLDFCTPEILRVRFAAGEGVPANTLTDGPGNTPMVVGCFEDPIEIGAHESETEMVLTTTALEVVINKHPWQMRLYPRGRRLPGGEIFATRSRRMPTLLADMGFSFDPTWHFYHRYAYPLGVAGQGTEAPQVFDSFDLAPDEHIYGFGESFLRLDKHGQKLNLWNEEVYNNTSAGAYKRIPFFASTRGYGLFLNTSYPITARMGDLTGIAASIIVHGCAALDYYLIYGPTLKEILPRYTAITGRPGLPPKWTFGHWMARLTYGSQEEVERVAAELREHRIPTDVVHIDTGWFTKPGCCDLQFDPERFPDPAGMVKRLRGQGFRLSLWQWPNMMIGNCMYEEAKARGYLVKRTDGQVYHQSGYQEDCAPLDYSNPEMVRWIQEKFRALFRLGAAVIKVDFGEGAPIDGVYAGPYPAAAMHNLYPLLYNKAIFEVTEECLGEGNAAIWARSAWAGSQRYPVHWSGDGAAMWRDMACTLRAGLSFGLSGFPFWSHDIGGFVGNPTPELYARWVQLGMFTSHARAHGAPPREPWCYGPQTEEIYRRYAELRYRLLPYIYSQAVEAVQRSLPMLRALVLEFQDDPTVGSIEDQYLFGDSILVAPILNETNHRRVYLPAGDWVDFWTKESVPGGRWLDIAAPLDTLPLWVRAGSILPLGPVMQHVEELPLDPLTVELYAPRGAGSFVVHDQGKPDVQITYQASEAMGQGLASVGVHSKLTVCIGPTPGQVNLHWYAATARAAEVNGLEVPIEPADQGQCIVFDGRGGTEVKLWLA